MDMARNLIAARTAAAILVAAALALPALRANCDPSPGPCHDAPCHAARDAGGQPSTWPDDCSPACGHLGCPHTPAFLPPIQPVISRAGMTAFGPGDSKSPLPDGVAPRVEIPPRQA